MKKKSKLPPAREINKGELAFHAYVIRCIMRLEWGLGEGKAMTDPALGELLRRYLEFVYGDDEWMKVRLLDILREQSYKEIKEGAIYYFPQIKNNRDYVPPEINLDFLKDLAPKKIVKESVSKEYLDKNLNLNNFSAIMGKRFRMTQDQKTRRLTREQAFQEWCRK